jgi:hypothetical protein
MRMALPVWVVGRRRVGRRPVIENTERDAGERVVFDVLSRGGTPMTSTPKADRRQPAEKDPDGVAPAKEAAKDEPKGLPNSDRHQMETAVAKQKGG